jgi:hypothetical protein
MSMVCLFFFGSGEFFQFFAIISFIFFNSRFCLRYQVGWESNSLKYDKNIVNDYNTLVCICQWHIYWIWKVFPVFSYLFIRKPCFCPKMSWICDRKSVKQLYIWCKRLWMITIHGFVNVNDIFVRIWGVFPVFRNYFFLRNSQFCPKFS